MDGVFFLSGMPALGMQTDVPLSSFSNNPMSPLTKATEKKVLVQSVEKKQTNKKKTLYMQSGSCNSGKLGIRANQNSSVTYFSR